jgi:plastocyanin
MHMSMSTRGRLLSLAIGGSLLVAACGGGGDGADEPAAGSTATETSASDAGATTTTVTMRDNEYAPADPVVTSGELELVNDGASPHTFTVDGESVDVEVEAGSKATASIDLEPGTYTVFCRFHRSQGMETTLTVE